jgi:hypothetical protein
MTLRSAHSARQTNSPLGRAALWGVVVTAGLALSLGLASASASPLRTSEQRHATFAAVQGPRCRRAGGATSGQDSACRRSSAGRARAAAASLTGASLIITWTPPTVLTVTITSGPTSGSTSTSSRASFGFSSSAAHSSFQCAIDAQPYSSCTSPAAYGGLANGVHKFKVYAVAGGISSHAASISWTVAVPGPHAKAPGTTPVAPTPPPPSGGEPLPTPTSPPGTGADPPAPLTSWMPATDGRYTPLSDAAAAADVTPTPENRPDNVTANDYMPTPAQLQAFYSAVNNQGQTVVQANPYYQYVTGHYSGTTDEIIQWAAWKWGIPADWLRAEYVQESRWNMSQLGDLATVSPAAYLEYPVAARVPGTDEVYQSMGISQVKWVPDGSVGAGTEPLRWESTAFNVDYQAATIRFYYDDPDGLRSAWGDSTYAPGNAWDSLGGWYEPYPWLNSGQLNYIAEVQAQLAARTWAQPGF